MYCDAHIHLLPGMDNGPSNAAEAFSMLRLMQDNGCHQAVITPHFYAERETLSSFIFRRKAALYSLTNYTKPTPRVRLALSAEVFVSPGVSRLPQLERLLIPHTRFLPVELPLGRLDDFVVRELSYMIHKRQIQPIICQTERYLIMMPPSDYDRLISLPNTLYEFTASALLDPAIATEILRLFSREHVILLGSNAHNAQERRPLDAQLEDRINTYAHAAYKLLSRRTKEILKPVFARN